MTTSNEDKKYLRRLGHNLKPVVTIAAKGLTEPVCAEIERALADHELIKIKLAVGDRAAKKAVIDRNMHYQRRGSGSGNWPYCAVVSQSQKT